MQEVLTGDEQEQVGLKNLRVRPSWSEVVGVVEDMKGERW